jgi:hypothetical protein
MADSPTKKIEEDKQPGTHEVPSIQEAPVSVLEDGSLDPV